MATHQGSSPRFARNALLVVACAICIFSPLAASAETVTLVRNAEQSQSPPNHGLRKKVRLALDDDGNVMVRYRKVSLTFIYEAGSGPQENRMQTKVATTRQEVACLGGVSVKFGLTF